MNLVVTERKSRLLFRRPARSISPLLSAVATAKNDFGVKRSVRGADLGAGSVRLALRLGLGAQNLYSYVMRYDGGEAQIRRD
jgi:hypothetical protein